MTMDILPLSSVGSFLFWVLFIFSCGLILVTDSFLKCIMLWDQWHDPKFF